jgi:hypothetical protein
MTIHQEGNFGHHSLLNPRQRRYFKFAFVRDPFDRLVSCYEDRVMRPVHAQIGRHHFDTDYNRVLVKTLAGSCFHQNMSFAEFVELTGKIPDFLADGHFKSQHGWLYRFGSRIPDYVGKLETLTEDWRPLAARFSLPELDHRNRSEDYELRDYFKTSETVRAAARRYWKDIRSFGYEDSFWRLQRSCKRQAGGQPSVRRV